MKNKSFALILLMLIFSGCVRLTGKAGYWKQGPEDAEPQVKQAGFDTANLTGQLPPEAGVERES